MNSARCEEIFLHRSCWLTGIREQNDAMNYETELGTELVFPAEGPGEEDAENIRSNRSPKAQWHSANGIPRVNGGPPVLEDLERAEG
jgi:hypothetical protein